MNNLKSDLNLNSILVEINAINNWIVDGTGVLMFQGQSKGIPYLGDGIAQAVQQICSFRNQSPLHLMINKIPKGVHVPKHRDWLLPSKQGEKPIVERWHLPIQTDDKSGWWDERNGEVSLRSGFWWGPMPYWIYHSVWNDSEIERVHLIVDLDTPLPFDKYATSHT